MGTKINLELQAQYLERFTSSQECLQKPFVDLFSNPVQRVAPPVMTSQMKSSTKDLI